MQVKDVMTANPACCSAETNLQAVAQLMVDNDCGLIPITQNDKPVGVITDRDIVIRTVAKGQNPLDLTAADCMSKPCVTVTPDTPIEECGNILETKKIRRVVAVDEAGRCAGIVALADIALRAAPKVTNEVVKEVSEPSTAASAAG